MFVGDSMPIGSVIHSMLTESQMQTYYGTGWILADGRSCTGTMYNKITSATTVPDMRGRFLRGKNNGSSSNPDGDLALGTYTADKFKSHDHTGYHNIAAAVGSSTPVYQFAADGRSSASTNFPSDYWASAIPEGSNETAPKSITLNIFIKVN